MQKTVLFLDSATEACAAGLMVDGVIHTCFEHAPRGHAQKLLPMAERLMADAGVAYADLDLVGFDRGPGSFTGVRIATGLAQGIAMARAIPLVPISSLHILAWQYLRLHRLSATDFIHVAIDARMQEIYYAVFAMKANRLQSVLPEQVRRPQLADFPGVGLGSGFQAWPELGALLTDVDATALPDPHAALELIAQTADSDWVVPDQALPEYLRNNVATPAKNP